MYVACECVGGVSVCVWVGEGKVIWHKPVPETVCVWMGNESFFM